MNVNAERRTVNERYTRPGWRSDVFSGQLRSFAVRRSPRSSCRSAVRPFQVPVRRSPFQFPVLGSSFRSSFFVLRSSFSLTLELARLPPAPDGRHLGRQLLGHQARAAGLSADPVQRARLLLASAVFLTALADAPPSGRPGRSRARTGAGLAFLGLVGHLLYQLFFLAGVARTSVANSSLIFGCTPVAVALLSSLAGHDRLTWPRWAGAALSLAGIYAIVGHRAELSTATLAGDAFVMGGMLCWSVYSVAAQPLLSGTRRWSSPGGRWRSGRRAIW